MVHSTIDQPFEIENARWELCNDDIIEDNGDCVIDGHCMNTLIKPLKAGNYQLYIKYQIADEELIEKIIVEVVR